jgi:hypothetical protein
MQSFSIVKDFDVFKKIRAILLLTGLVSFVMDTFDFERVKETSDDHVIEAVSILTLIKIKLSIKLIEIRY